MSVTGAFRITARRIRNLRAAQQLETFIDAIRVLKDLPAMKLAKNKTLVSEIKNVLSSRGMGTLVNAIHRDYIAEKDAAFNAEKKSDLHPESPEFLHAFARFKTAAHNVLAENAEARYLKPVAMNEATAFNAPAAVNARKELSKKIEALREAKDFAEVFNSVFSDHALQIGTQFDPTRISSYIDYSPYIWNYQYYLSIPTLSQTIDRGIQIATREMPRIDCEDEELGELLEKVFKRSRFVEKLRRMLLFSHLSPRGAAIVPIETEDQQIRFNIFNDTQFTYSTGYQYTRLDFRDDGADGVTQLFVLGKLLRNGVTAHFLCPGFEPIFAIGKNRIFQLKDAAEAINIYLYTVKVLCIRAQVMVQKWGGEGQNDTLLQKMKNLTDDIDSRLSLNTAVKLPEGADLTILNNNLSEGFAKISPIIKEYQGMLSGIMPDYFYGSDTAYSANSFNIHATHQNIRSEIQEGQIEPIYCFCINQLLRHDKRFSKWSKNEDDFDIEFESLYEPTDSEKADNEKKRIDNIITMAGYPELAQIFKDEGLLGDDYDLPVPVQSPTVDAREPGEDQTPPVE